MGCGGPEIAKGKAIDRIAMTIDGPKRCPNTALIFKSKTKSGVLLNYSREILIKIQSLNCLNILSSTL